MGPTGRIPDPTSRYSARPCEWNTYMCTLLRFRRHFSLSLWWTRLQALPSLPCEVSIITAVRPLVRFSCRFLISPLVATLALSFWDFLTTFEDEVCYIWPMKKRHAFKWLYIFHRHFLLVVQITSQIAFPLLPAVSSPTSYNCRALLTVMTVLVECANFTLEFILAFRVFALFGRRPWVSRLLGCLILGEIICCMPTSFSGLNSYAGGILFQLSPDVNIQMAFTMVVHSTLISLTVARHISIGRTRGNGSNIVSQFTRDGTATFLMVMGLIGLGVATSAVKDLQPIILFFWALTCHSICGSRLILMFFLLRTRIDIQTSEPGYLSFSVHSPICLEHSNYPTA
ncbi:hypothetical protein F5141DRAFT_596790 [Pisolithus sp. B1]|nr:hypothetical protein F5141DRAFT_596790 [Pisolithus sp. B1]